MQDNRRHGRSLRWEAVRQPDRHRRAAVLEGSPDAGRAANTLAAPRRRRAPNFSARTPFDRNRALWGGFVIRAGARCIYFAGDSAYADFFREIPSRLGPVDLALLPIGAYEPRWFMRVVHMNPAEAVQAHLDLGAPETIGMHFGRFQLTNEGIDEPLRALEQALRGTHTPSRSAFGESKS